MYRSNQKIESIEVRIAEVFESIQGEGEFCGTASVFVRTTGCNLRCWFCDTPYSSLAPEGTQQDWKDLLASVLRKNCRHVVLTGGEPMLQPGMVPLSQELREAGRYVTVETAGTIHRPVAADLMSISPKLANSTPKDHDRWQIRHERDRTRPDVIRQLISEYHYQFKFVIDQPSDLKDVEQYLAEFPEIDLQRVWLMPQGISEDELQERTIWLAPAADKMGVRLSPRKHIELYGHVRGT